MAATIAPASLKSLLEGKEPFALIDVREAGEYNSSHIPGASLIARRQLETVAPQAVPFIAAPSAECQDSAGRTEPRGRAMSNASRVQRIAFKGRQAPARTEEIRQAVRSFIDKLPFLGALSYDVEFAWSSEFPGDPWFWSLRVMPRDGGSEIPPLFVQELADEVRGLFENDLRVG